MVARARERFASLSMAAFASRNGTQRATLSGRNCARDGSSSQPISPATLTAARRKTSA